MLFLKTCSCWLANAKLKRWLLADRSSVKYQRTWERGNVLPAACSSWEGSQDKSESHLRESCLVPKQNFNIISDLSRSQFHSTTRVIFIKLNRDWKSQNGYNPKSMCSSLSVSLVTAKQTGAGQVGGKKKATTNEFHARASLYATNNFYIYSIESDYFECKIR